MELAAFCDRLLHSLVECCHATLALDATRLTIVERGGGQSHPDACQRLPHVLQVLRYLGPDVFIGPTLFERCMHFASVFLKASESEELQEAMHASACALTMLSALKVSASCLQTTPTLFYRYVVNDHVACLLYSKPQTFRVGKATDPKPGRSKLYSEHRFLAPNEESCKRTS